VARSTAWLWVRHLPLDPSTERAQAKAEHSKLMTDARWMKHRADRDAEHERVTSEAAAFVGDLSEREILLLGAAIYWCEGSKSKPWRRSERIIFTNSDPHLIRLFLMFLRTVGLKTDQIGFRISIHETADIGSRSAVGGAARCPDGGISAADHQTSQALDEPQEQRRGLSRLFGR